MVTAHADAARLQLRDLVISVPLIAASGAVDPCSDDPDWRFPIEPMRHFGAAVTKTATLQPRAGNPPPWVEVIPTDSRSLINAVGLANPGIEATLDAWNPMVKVLEIPMILSIGGDAKECAHMARIAGEHACVSGIEINLSCPNTEQVMPAESPVISAAIISHVRRATELPIIAKLSAASHITEVARAVVQAGADAITAVNTMPVIAVDDDGRQMLGTLQAGMSGRALHTIALRCVSAVANTVDVPIIGVGGVASPQGVQQMRALGASAVGIGTAAVLDPSIVNLLASHAACIPARNML